jgi:chromate transporter
VLLAGAGLMAAAAAPLARDAITGPVTLAIVAASFVLIAVTRVDTLWIMLGAAIVGFLSFQL